MPIAVEKRRQKRHGGVVPFAPPDDNRPEREETAVLPVIMLTASDGPEKTLAIDAAFRLREVYAFPNPARRRNPTIHVACGVADTVEIRTCPT